MPARQPVTAEALYRLLKAWCARKVREVRDRSAAHIADSRAELAQVLLKK